MQYGKHNTILPYRVVRMTTKQYIWSPFYTERAKYYYCRFVCWYRFLLLYSLRIGLLNAFPEMIYLTHVQSAFQSTWSVYLWTGATVQILGKLHCRALELGKTLLISSDFWAPSIFKHAIFLLQFGWDERSHTCSKSIIDCCAQFFLPHFKNNLPRSAVHE